METHVTFDPFDAARCVGGIAGRDLQRHGVAGSQLHLNKGGLQFEQVGKQKQLAGVGWAYGACLADLDNERKRCAVQVGRAVAETRAAVARQWLPVVDNLDRALAHSAADPAAIIDGIEAVRAQALDVLTRLGFPLRDDRGARFDPARHEAVASRPAPGAEAGSVTEVILPAYGEGDHQLRPAQVVVARPD